MSLRILRSFRGVWPVVKLADDTYINDISEINVLRMRQRCSRLWRGAGLASVVYSRQFNCFLTGADRSTEYDMMLHRRSLATSLQWRGHIHRKDRGQCPRRHAGGGLSTICQ